MFNEKRRRTYIWRLASYRYSSENQERPQTCHGLWKKSNSIIQPKKFDYVSVPYPEGNITEDYNLFFNHHMIEEILYMGYVTNEELNYKKTLGPKMHDKEI